MLVRGFVVRVTLMLAVVFLAVAFLGTVPAFGATGLATSVVGGGDLFVTPVEAAVFLAPVLPLEVAALAALGLVLMAVFLAVGMAAKVKGKLLTCNGRRALNGSGRRLE